MIKPDYAKWMLDDPRVNFAISTRGREPGLDHLGIQVEDADELNEVYARFHEAGGNISIKARPLAVTPGPRNPGSMIPPVSPGRLPHHRREHSYGDGTGENGARIAHEKEWSVQRSPAGRKGFGIVVPIGCRYLSQSRSRDFP